MHSFLEIIWQRKGIIYYIYIYAKEKQTQNVSSAVHQFDSVVIVLYAGPLLKSPYTSVSLSLNMHTEQLCLNIYLFLVHHHQFHRQRLRVLLDQLSELTAQ